MFYCGAQRVALRRLAVAAAVLQVGCFGADPPAGRKCSDSSRCPEGQFCHPDGICREQPPGLVADASAVVGIDSAADASVDRLIDHDLRISTSDGNSLIPVVAWGSGGYGVAWVEDIDGNNEIFFARVSASGTIVHEVQVSSATGYSTAPSMVWTGNVFALVWTDNRDGNAEIYFSAVDASGYPVTDNVRITNDPGSSLSASLTWTGTELGLAWEDNRDGNFEIYFARLDEAGQLLGGPLRITEDDGVSQSAYLHWANNRYFLGWQDSRHGSDEIYLKTLDSTGATVNTELRLTDAEDLSGSVALVWTPTRLAVVWEDFRTDVSVIYGALLDLNLVVLQGEFALSDPAVESSQPSVVWADGELGVSWQVNVTDNDTDLFIRRIGTMGESISPAVEVTKTDGKSFNGRLLWNGSEYAAVWTDNRDDNLEVYLREIVAGECDSDDDCDNADDVCVAFACAPAP